MKLPPKKRPGNPILASDWNAMVDALAARTPRPSAGLELSSNSGGFIYRMKPVAGSSPPPIPDCPFGQIITWKDGEGEEATTKTAIKGGVVYAGGQVWNVDDKELNLSASGSYCVWLSVDVTANSEDDVLMPGLSGSSQPEWNQASDYEDMDIPTADSPDGTAILAVGALVIADDKATLSATGCGGFAIGHCPGSLNIARI